MDGGLTGWLVDVMHALGYAGIFLLLVLARVIPPVPAESVIPLAGMGAAAGEYSLLGIALAGGLGSLAGSLVASLLIGVFTSFAVGLDWSLAGLLGTVGLGDWAREVGGLLTLTLSSVSGTVPFLLMLIVLLVRPAGLMGAKN